MAMLCEVPPHFHCGLRLFEFSEIDPAGLVDTVVADRGEPRSFRIAGIKTNLRDAFVADQQMPRFAVFSPDWKMYDRHGASFLVELEAR